MYKSLAVPIPLQAALVRPHLNERARNFSLEKVRDAILAEYKLSPHTYLDKYNAITRAGDETTVMFTSKLESLLNYFLEARKVKVKDFPNLRELLICDRIKSTLSEACLRYILSVESTKNSGRMGVRDLTTAVDKYLSTHVGNKPRAYTIVTSRYQKPSNTSGVSGFGGKTPPPPRPLPPKPFGRPPFGESQVGYSASTGSGTRRCFTCNSPNHFRSQCPNNATNVQGSRADDNSRNVKKVNACQLGSIVKRSHNYRNKGSNSSRHNVENDNRDCKPDSSGSASNEMHAQDRALDEAAALFRGNSSGYALVNETVAVTERQQDFIGSDVTSPDVSNVSKQRASSHVIPSDHMSQLSYLPVRIS